MLFRYHKDKETYNEAPISETGPVLNKCAYCIAFVTKRALKGYHLGFLCAFFFQTVF